MALPSNVVEYVDHKMRELERQGACDTNNMDTMPDYPLRGYVGSGKERISGREADRRTMGMINGW